MSNLDNFFPSCPGLMSDGRTSVITDYKTKNYTFKENIGTSTNSYQFRDRMQKNGLSNIKDSAKFNTCSTVPLGNIVVNKEIKLEYATGGNLANAFKTLVTKDMQKNGLPKINLLPPGGGKSVRSSPRTTSSIYSNPTTRSVFIKS
jgi:hypothetical protein